MIILADFQAKKRFYYFGGVNLNKVVTKLNKELKKYLACMHYVKVTKIMVLSLEKNKQNKTKTEMSPPFLSTV